MEDLLPYYERELTFLRRHSREFAERFPKVAGRLSISGDVCEDPHVERMIESFALLAARVHKKLDDDFPEFTETLLDVLYPHYLRPFPSCSIARFGADNAVGQLSSTVTIPRGTELFTRPAKGVSCKFRTAYAVQVAPLRVVGASFNPTLQAPEGVRLPATATAALTLTFELTSDQASFAALGGDRIRLFLDGETSLVAAIRDHLFSSRVVVSYAQSGGAPAPWHLLTGPVVQPVGFADDEALIDFDSRSHPAYRMLTEYFAFPEKFNFIDVDLSAMDEALRASARQISIHVLFSGVRADSNDSRLLERLSALNFVPGCTPVVNLFRQHADPVRVTHRASRYPVVPDSRRAYAYELYSIDSVKRVQQTPQGESVTEFRPFYSLHHGETARKGGRYWHLHRDTQVGAQSPGFEYEISLVDIDFDPTAEKTETLSIELTCTNRDMPSQLPYGVAGGDLFMEGGSVARGIALLRKPTPTYRFERGKGALWRLISHLTLNHLSLVGSGVQAFKEALCLYDLSGSAANQRQIDGLLSIEHGPATAWLPGNPFPAFVRGVEVRMTVDEKSYVGTGISLFAQVLDHFLGLYVQANSFTELVLVSQRNHTEILRCPPRNGASPLV